VLADAVRTDRARLRPLTQDSPATVTLRMTVRDRKDLIAARVAMANQLRAHLDAVLPGTVGLFRDIDSPISLRFLARFPSQDKVDWLSPVRLQNWLSAAGYNNPGRAGTLHAHLAAAAQGTTGTEAAARTSVTLALVAALAALREQIRALDDAIATQLDQHPDAAVFTSLPRSGPSAPPGCSPRSATPAAKRLIHLLL
jgi:transposase